MPILFSDVTVVPMDGAPQVLEHAYVAVEGRRSPPWGPSPPEGTFDRVVDGAGKVLLPGFVNAHTHLPMTLMRGYGGGMRPAHLAQPVYLSCRGAPGQPGGGGGGRAGPGGDDRLRRHLCS